MVMFMGVGKLPCRICFYAFSQAVAWEGGAVGDSWIKTACEKFSMSRWLYMHTRMFICICMQHENLDTVASYVWCMSRWVSTSFVKSIDDALLLRLLVGGKVGKFYNVRYVLMYYLHLAIIANGSLKFRVS